MTALDASNFGRNAGIPVAGTCGSLNRFDFQGSRGTWHHNIRLRLLMVKPESPEGYLRNNAFQFTSHILSCAA